MNERERLTELMKEVKFTPFKDGGGLDVSVRHQLPDHAFEAIADNLLESGIIVAPCKIGTTLYMIVTKRSKVCLPPFSFVKVTKLTYYNLERVIDGFGVDVFLTREEAEAKLKEKCNCDD